MRFGRWEIRVHSHTRWRLVRTDVVRSGIFLVLAQEPSAFGLVREPSFFILHESVASVLMRKPISLFLVYEPVAFALTHELAVSLLTNEPYSIRFLLAHKSPECVDGCCTVLCLSRRRGVCLCLGL